MHRNLRRHPRSLRGDGVQRITIIPRLIVPGNSDTFSAQASSLCRFCYT